MWGAGVLAFQRAKGAVDGRWGGKEHAARGRGGAALCKWARREEAAGAALCKWAERADRAWREALPCASGHGGRRQLALPCVSGQSAQTGRGGGAALCKWAWWEEAAGTALCKWAECTDGARREEAAGAALCKWADNDIQGDLIICCERRRYHAEYERDDQEERK